MSFDESDLSTLDLPLLHAGKVRRLYRWPTAEGAPERLLMVATDAVSAYDHVLSRPIPDKGAILTQLSQWWFEQLTDIVDNHVVSLDVPEVVLGRAVICEALQMFPIECVARGYLTGSGWAEYQRTQSVCEVELPAGLHDGSRLPEPIFTPATKAELGDHDENIDFARMISIVGAEAAHALRDLTLRIYSTAEKIARGRGIILADTKVEFGARADGTIVLADEVLTPDSSRFWDAEAWEQGVLESYDKQYLRNWLIHESGWSADSDEAPPALPDDVVDATRGRYLEAYRTLTGSDFEAS